MPETNQPFRATSNNGGSTRPLTEHAKSELRRLCQHPCPPQEVNPGVRDRFWRDGLIEEIKRPSPYKKDKGADIIFIQASQAGRDLVASWR